MTNPMTTHPKAKDYTMWLIHLKYLLKGAVILPIMGNPEFKNVPDRKAWKHFFDEGYTPLEAMLIDINES